ncbi:transposase [Cellulophaga sp. BC115SP]|uniref:transposase n=1 Tax=Cellulophaga sp. BC115SP TaxID=2683263 RepID=UPI001411F3DF|nr:transposase [Cellulophaga sp. BC115SP]
MRHPRWSYGFKLHLVINSYGQIVNWLISAGNVSDNNADLLKKLIANLQGICVGDKGDHTSLLELFYTNGLYLVLKPEKNMKQQCPANYNNQ